MIVLNISCTLEAFDSKPTEYGQIIHTAQIKFLSFDIYKNYNVYLYISYCHNHFIIESHP